MAVYKRVAVKKLYRTRSAKKPRYARLSPYTPKSIMQGFNKRDGIFGFPTSLRTKLRYVENITLQSVSGTATSNSFRANSLHDPNETGVGHQPMYFDTLTAVYRRYVVRGSVIRVIYNAVTETAASSCWQVGILGQGNTTVDNTASTNCEQGHSVFADVNGRNGNSGQKVLTMKYTPEACLNLTTKDTDVGATAGSNPDQSYKFVVWAQDLQATGTTNLVATVEIIFDCEFSQVIAQSAS